MRGRVRGQRLDQPVELVGRQSMGHNEDPEVGTVVGKELESEADEIVPVPGDQTAAVLGGPLKLLPVGEPFGPHLMRAYRIDASGTEKLSDPLAEVLIQVVLHRRSATSDGCRPARRSGVQASFRDICRSISSG